MAAVRAGHETGNNIWLTDVRQLQWIPGPLSYEKSDANSVNPTVVTYPPGSDPNYGVPPVTGQPQPGYTQYGGTPQV